MNQRENLLRAVRFETPDYIPMAFHINGACWQRYPQDALQDLMASHPFLFPGFEKTAEEIKPDFHPTARAGEPFTDDWGCVWETTENGIAGAITKHPLADWSAFAGYRAPDPNVCTGAGPVDWRQVEEGFRKAREEGRLRGGGLPHGHTFLRLSYIRGYENLVCDMAEDEPRLRELIRMVEDFNMAVVRRTIDLGAEWMGYPEDLGMQIGPMISPDLFRKRVKPTYERLMAPAREAGCIVHMHSDGDIRQLVDDLIDGGVEVINLQDLVNGIDWIKDRLAGRVCVDLDVDRQSVTRWGSPEDVDSLIREEVEKLGGKRGGLMMIYGLYPGVPLRNVKALMDAMEKYAFHFS
ncbi:MAG TPA: uroporphyrinogen decarboxylase family protein [Sumerlaeia bacterium]|nr:uroporphyrinogen decarboxylase family protein [Sumerlaeia bacterium]